jgi:HK97 family phage portal protein
MGWMFRILGRSGANDVKMSSAQLAEMMRGARLSGAGAVVNWQSSLRVTTMIGIARVLGDGLSQVPFRLMQLGEGGERRIARDHPLFDLLYRRPNSWQTSFEFRETICSHVVLTGNAFIWKGMVGRARRVASLEPLEPGRECMVRRENGKLVYSGVRDGRPVTYAPDEIWHIRGPSWNGWEGMDAVRQAREAIGLAIATESAHADFHRNGARVSGVHSVAGNLSQAKFDQLSAWLDRHSQGGDRAGKPVILDMEAKFSTTQMSGVDAQHLETRRFQIEEMCRAFRVMPIMLGQSDKVATYASAEQMFLAHVVHTLMPWYERIEQSADINLLSEEERQQGYYTKFNANALLRGAAKDRADYFSKALGSGGSPAWMSQDEVRALEELDPRGGPADILSAGAMNKPDPGSTGA